MPGASAHSHNETHHAKLNATNEDTMLEFYFEVGRKLKSITGILITAAVRQAAKILRLEKQGIGIDNNISSHSLRAGGTMVLHLIGVDVNTIKKMGRWSSDTFLMYTHIQEQVPYFSKGLSQKMAKHVPFHNVAFKPIQSIPMVYKPPSQAFNKLKL